MTDSGFPGDATVPHNYTCVRSAEVLIHRTIILHIATTKAKMPSRTSSRKKSAGTEMESAKIKTLITPLKVVDLKKCLDGLGLHSKGLKADLRDRICNYIAKQPSEANRLVELVSIVQNTVQRLEPSMSSLAMPSAPPIPYPEPQKYHAKLSFEQIPYFKVLKQLSQFIHLKGDSVTIKFQLDPLNIGSLLNNPKRRILLSLGAHINGQSTIRVAYPERISIRVNETTVNPSQYQGLKKKPWTGKPLDITPYSKISESQNVIQLNWNSDQNLVCVLQLVECVEVTALVDSINQTRFRSLDDVMNMHLTIKREAELVATMEQVSMKDPASKCRIQLPIRAENCRHIQAFDCLTYLTMNQRISIWECPVCSQPAPFNSLYVDGYFLDIITRAGDAESVDIFADCTWSISVADEVEEASLYNIETNTGFILCDSDSPGGSAVTHSSHINVPSSTNRGSKTKNVIDLTLSDSEDDYNAPEIQSHAVQSPAVQHKTPTKLPPVRQDPEPSLKRKYDEFYRQDTMNIRTNGPGTSSNTRRRSVQSESSKYPPTQFYLGYPPEETQSHSAPVDSVRIGYIPPIPNMLGGWTRGMDPPSQMLARSSRQNSPYVEGSPKLNRLPLLTKAAAIYDDYANAYHVDASGRRLEHHTRREVPRDHGLRTIPISHLEEYSPRSPHVRFPNFDRQ